MTFLDNGKIAETLKMSDVISCVESVYVQKANDQTVVWPTTFYEFNPGHADMDIKSGYLKGAGLFGHKTVSWVEANKDKGLPDLNGIIVVYSDETGIPLGVLEASYITGMRTGAAGAVGAKYLARKDSETLLIAGAGNQAYFQVLAMVSAFPKLKRILIANPRTPEKAVSFANVLPERLKASGAGSIPDISACEIKAGCEAADIIITCTSAREALIKSEWVKPGTHFSCIGADMPGKQEIDEKLFDGALVYADDLMHCISSGEMETALKKGIIKESDIKGEIGSLILGKIEGRTNDRQISIFDATGMALLDIATAKIALDAVK